MGRPVRLTTGARRAGVAVGLLALLLGAGWFAGDTVLAAVLGLLESARGAGPAGMGIYGLAALVATVTMLPASWVQASAGFLYGPWLGALVAWMTAVGFGSLNFFLGRTALRGWVRDRLEGRPTLQALDGAVAERGLYVTALMRLSPMAPFNVVCYALGTTGVRTRDYLLGTATAAVVPVLFYSSIGASLSHLEAVVSGEAGPGATGWWLAAVLTIATTAAIATFATRELRRVLAVSSG